MKKGFFILSLLFSLQSVFSQKTQTETYKAENNGYFITPLETPYGIVFTDNFASKIYLLQDGKVKTLVQSPGCGRYFTVSLDGMKIGYKSINQTGKQAPAVYDLSSEKTVLLNDYSDLSSQVTLTVSGDFAYFKKENSKLTCLKSNIYNKNLKQNINNASFSNIAPVSPDGKFIVYDTDLKYLIIRNLETEEQIKLPNDGKGVIYPKWSPDSKKILFQNRDMELLVYEKETKALYKIGKGGAGNWDAKSQLIVYQKTDADPINFILKSSEIYISDYKGKDIRQITFTPDVYEMTPSFDLQGGILYQTYDKRQIIRAKLNNSKTAITSTQILLDNPQNLKPNFYDVTEFTQSKSITHLSKPVPYIHQLYDAPTGRNGNSACAPTTSTMALAYYNRLPKWPVPAENYPSVTGSGHKNDYSGYVLDRYKYNEHSFDAYSSTKNAYGGYAYMWVDPYTSPGSGGMQAFQNLHDMNSGSYVWLSNATFEKTQNEINNEYPHPICSWITHSGHLTLVTGYVNGQHTAIFNDPWGNKNTPGYPSYDGAESYYDWPGYNNGYENLDPDGSHGTVAWTLTARSSEPVYDDLTIENINYGHGFYVNNSENGSTQRYFRHAVNAAGHSGQIWWTGGEGGASSDICYVTWTPNIASSATYKVEVYIPAAFTDTYSAAAVTNSAYYKIYYDGGNTTVSVDQYANRGTWVDLGTYPFVSGQSAYVYLGDAVASGDNGKKVLFDAVKFTQVSSSLELSITDVTCKGSDDGTATVISVPGSSPYTYSWSHDAGNTTNTATNLAPGTYTVTVTNSEAIPEVYEETFMITEADVALSLSTSSTDPSTVGGSNGEITANISGGGTPYSISWSHDGSNTTNTATGLSSGEYTVTVTDAFGCTLQETVTLFDPDCCTLLRVDFSDGLPNGWTNTVNPGAYASYVWRFDDPGGRYGAGSLAGADFDADFVIFDDDYLGDNGNKSDASLTTKAIDCSDRNDVILKMTHKFRHSANTATGKLEVSNDSSAWNLIESWSAATEDPIVRTWDISAYAANQPTVYIRWTYTDNSNWSNYWAIDNVEVYAPLSGTFTVKPDGTGDFGSMTDAINDLNHCGVGSGGATFLVEAGDVFEEELPEITATGTAANPVVFKTSDASGTNPIIKSAGSVGTEAGITLAGCDYFTFDGIDIQISSGSALEYGYYLYNPAATDGCQHNTIKNCSITLNKSNTNSAGINQYIQSSLDPISVDGTNSFNTYENITISNAYFGMSLYGLDKSAASELYDNDCIVSNCTISNFGGSSLRAAGIIAWGQKNSDYFNNEISDGSTMLRTYGIYIAEYSDGNIHGNTIYNLYGTDIHVVGIRTYAANFSIYDNDVSDIEGIKMATGIEAYGGTSTVYNNFIYDIKAPSGNSTANAYPSTRGISLRATSGTQEVYYNSVYVAYTSTDAGNESTCLYLENSAADLRNNIFENNSDATTGTRANVMYFKTAADLGNLSVNTNNNCYYNGIATSKYALAYDAGNTVDYLDLSAYKAASPNDANSIEENPPFKSTSSPYDLHIDVTQTTGLGNGGTPIAGYTTDYDGDTRDAATPDIGADEYAAGGPLCGTYTIDNTSATGGINFNNFTDAINALNERGISCAVSFNVSAGQTFNEDPPSCKTTGTSADTITFRRSGTGANPIIKPTGTSADEDFGIHLDGVDHYTFDGIDIQIASGDAVEFGYYLTTVSPTDGAQHNTVQNCTIILNVGNVNSAGVYQLVRKDITPTSADGANSFNVYDSISVENAFHGFKIFGYDVSGQEPLYDDATEIKNCSVNNFGYTGSTSRAVGILTWSQKNLSIHGNTISNGTTDGRTLGIYGAGNNSGDFYDNRVHGLYGTGSQVVGLRTYESDVNFYNNTVYDVEGTDMASGIEIYGGSAYIYNNFVSDIRTPGTDTYNYPTARGISDRAGDAYIYNNSIFLNYVSSAETNESAGIFVEGFYGATAAADIRNNIIVNKTDVSIGAVAAALYKSAEYATISSNSDNNLYYAGTPSAKNLIYYDTNDGDEAIDNYKVRCGTYEQNSISEDAPFVSTSDLHIRTSAVTYIDGGAQVVGLITADYDGDTRDATTPDIGADEYDCDYIVWRGTTDTDWAKATNWRKQQVPTSSDNVIIPDVSLESNNFPIVTSFAETNGLSILSGAILQVNPNYSLTVNGTADNQAGTTGLVIKSDVTGTGSFINATADVPASAERYLTGTQWHYLSSPVVDASLSMFNTNNFYYYDETTADSWTGGVFGGTMGWMTATVPTLSSMQGYAYYFYPTTLNFSGNLHAGSYEKSSLSLTNSGMGSAYDGWHLLGNPYPSAIDFCQTKVDAGYISLTDVKPSVYYYDDAIHAYRGYNLSSGGINGGTEYIPAMQGFFVQVSADDAVFGLTNDARVHNPTGFYKSRNTAAGEEEFLTLQVSANGYIDETKLLVNENATFGFDGMYDLYKMYSPDAKVSQIWLRADDGEIALNAVPYFDETQIYTLGFKGDNANVYEIRLTESNLTQDVYLKDNLLNVSRNLKTDPVYGFMHSGGVTFDRFELHFSKSTNTEKISDRGILVYPNPSSGQFTIYDGQSNVKSIEIIDVTGKILNTLFVKKTGEIFVDLSPHGKGVYFIKIRSEDNSVIERRIVLE